MRSFRPIRPICLRHPVVRGLVQKPEDWEWSSYRDYATGFEGAVEIESEWTARPREQAGLRPTVRTRARVQFPPKQSLDGAPQ